MTRRSALRLLVLQVLVLSLLATLLGRLYYVQVANGTTYTRAAAENRIREIVTPAPRGQILDSRGRPLARNRTALVVSVSRTEMLKQRDRGRAMLQRVAQVIGKPFDDVWARTRLCGSPGAPKPPTCWNGSPYQPIPVTDEASPQMALSIVERQEDYPGVTAEVEAARYYPAPAGANAAHLLGYLGPVTDEEIAARAGAAGAGRTQATLRRTDLVGRSGLERTYDEDLRGVPGVEKLAVDHLGGVTGTVGETDPVPGNHLVTHLDAEVQAVAEKELLAAIRRARTTGDINKGGRRYKADSGAIVVMDVTNGGIVAMASWPTYDPNIWVGGISPAAYKAVTSPALNYPNQSRATQGQFAPASTFKAVTLPAAVRAGYSVHASYPCPSAYSIGGRPKRNYESQGYGTISMLRAIQVSCDTVFYKFAYETWLRQGKLYPPKGVKDPFTETAKGFGLGRRTGIDLPGEAPGRIADRDWKRSYWNATKDFYCTKARSGYPEVARDDPARARYLVQLSKENCVDGWAYRGGDAANFAIGQGDTVTTPLQMAVVYAAIANGGTLWEPHVGKAVMSPTGKVVRTIAPRSNGRVPVDAATLTWLRNAFRTVTENGTGRGPFRRAGFPLNLVPIGSKTGTGEVYGKQTTSWFASFAPANKPRYAVVMMVSQGGTGSGTSGPAVAGVYKAIFGVQGDRVVPSLALQPGGRPPVALPKVGRDGVIAAAPLHPAVLRAAGRPPQLPRLGPLRLRDIRGRP